MTQHTPSDPKIRAEIVAALYSAAEAALDPAQTSAQNSVNGAAKTSRPPAEVVSLKAYRNARTPVQIMDQSSIVFWDDLELGAPQGRAQDAPQGFRPVETNVVAFRRA